MPEYVKPFVQIACLCENCLIDKKDDVISLIRIVDEIQINPEELERAEGKPTPVTNLKAFVLFKGGPDKFDVKASSVDAEGQVRAGGTASIVLKGGRHGNNLIISVQLPVDRPGDFRLEFKAGEAVMATIPYRIVLKPSAGEIKGQ